MAVGVLNATHLPNSPSLPQSQGHIPGKASPLIGGSAESGRFQVHAAGVVLRQEPENGPYAGH